jgi:hypothetical protein
MEKFVRKLQHRVTKEGVDFYAISVPPQVAHALGLKDGGLVTFEIEGGKVVFKTYSKEPVMVPSLVFDSKRPAGFDMVNVPLEHPKIKGPSKDVEVQILKPALRTIRTARQLLTEEVHALGGKRRKRTI